MMILNQTQLVEMQELLGDNFNMLLDIFYRDSKTQIDTIKEWGSSSQNPQTIMAAHTLKSSAANLGLELLASQCDSVETACREGLDQEVQTLTSSIESIYLESITALAEATIIENA